MSRWTNAIPGMVTKVYLELGTQHGTTFDKVKARKKYGVDCQYKTGTHFMTTRQFFTQWGQLGLEPPDVIYIDACHEFEQALFDFCMSVHILKPGGLIIAHDLIPPYSYYASHPDDPPGEIVRFCKANDCYKILYWALKDGLRWAPGCYSNVNDYGCTVFPMNMLPPDTIPPEIYRATWDDLIALLRPEHKLTDEQFAERLAGGQVQVPPIEGLDPLHFDMEWL